MKLNIEELKILAELAEVGLEWVEDYDDDRRRKAEELIREIFADWVKKWRSTGASADR